MKTAFTTFVAAVSSAALSSAAFGQIRITEWEYSGNGSAAEFIEITNVGSAPINLAGWSYDDDSRTPGTVPLGAFGTLAPTQSALLVEDSAFAFRTAWNLGLDVPVIGGNTVNLGRADEINIYNAGNGLVDRLTYNDQGSAGGPRTQGRSGNPSSLAALGANNANLWVLSSVGDIYGSYASSQNDIGNPGKFTIIPEPTVLGAVAAVGVLASRRRRA